MDTLGYLLVHLPLTGVAKSLCFYGGNPLLSSESYVRAHGGHASDYIYISLRNYFIGWTYFCNV